MFKDITLNNNIKSISIIIIITFCTHFYAVKQTSRLTKIKGKVQHHSEQSKKLIILKEPILHYLGYKKQTKSDWIRVITDSRI